MATLDKRIESLEKIVSKASASIRVVFCEKGETTEQACIRVGAADDALTLVIHFCKGQGQ